MCSPGGQQIQTDPDERRENNSANTPNDKFGLGDRYPLQIWISDVNMKTWFYKKTLSDLPGAFSYPDGIVTDDGHILFAFEFNRHDTYFVDHEILPS